MSATHRYHPNPDRGDPEDAVLWDDCERCDEHAKDPGAGLDAGNLYTLNKRRIAGGPAPSHNEMKAMNRIGLAVRMTRIIDAEIDRRTDKRKDH
jgi:hypothetical protein